MLGFLRTVEFRILVCLILMVGCVLWNERLKAQTSLPMDPDQWTVETCPGTAKPTATGDGGIQFAWPAPPGCVGALSFSFKHPTAISGTLTSTLKMQVDPATVFVAADFAQGNTDPTPATTRFAIYVQGWDKHKTCPQGSDCANQRWFTHSSTDVDPVTHANTPPTAYPLANGSATLSKALTPGTGSALSSDPDNCHWINVYGECADSDAAHIAAFNSAIGNVVKLAQVYGAGKFFAHGVEASGPATFQLYSLGWQ